jgi:hypothetical protein
MYLTLFPTSPMVINPVILRLPITLRNACVGHLPAAVLMESLSYLQYVVTFSSFDTSTNFPFFSPLQSHPESVVGSNDSEPNNTYIPHNSHHSNPEEPQFLSPNHRPIPLPQTQTRAESPAIPRFTTPGDTSGLPTRPNSPIGFIDVNGGGGFPPGFIPQSITDARGRSTPINGFIPPLSPISGGGGGLGFLGMTPAPIYGNPITLERDKKREEVNAAPPPTRSHSPVADWSAPLAALHPPIFPITGHQQPFQHPPPGSEGTWGGGGGSSTTAIDYFSGQHTPVLTTRPIIPGQVSPWHLS